MRNRDRQSDRDRQRDGEKETDAEEVREHIYGEGEGRQRKLGIREEERKAHLQR